MLLANFMRIFLSYITIGLLFAGLSNAHASADDLTYYLPPGEVLWLGASAEEVATAVQNEESAPLRMLLLAKASETYDNRGSMIFITELGTHPRQSLTLSQWYQGMPAYGWDTFAMQSPTSQVLEFNWQQDSHQRYPEASDIGMLLDAMAARLRLALAHAASQSEPIVLVAEGVSAALVTDLLSSGDYPQVTALVTLAAHYPQWQLNQTLATTTAQLSMPTLDIIPQRSHTWVQDSSARRSQQAQQHQHPSYRQRQLVSNHTNAQPRYLLHLLYGWLKNEGF